PPIVDHTHYLDAFRTLPRFETQAGGQCSKPYAHGNFKTVKSVVRGFYYFLHRGITQREVKIFVTSADK
ncbi:MAG: hypothetical protein KDD69_20360, partial [Bdellovibrionales bacterium]|nr:hypothetical protein [Bdellovibrionales bacterium]